MTNTNDQPAEPMTAEEQNTMRAAFIQASQSYWSIGDSVRIALDKAVQVAGRCRKPSPAPAVLVEALEQALGLPELCAEMNDCLDDEREELEREFKAVRDYGNKALTAWREGGGQGRAAFQARVAPWMQACFGPEISADQVERGDRLLEEVFELLQSGGYDVRRVAALRDYVWGRLAGEPSQEVGGVMVTLAAYCLAHDLDMHAAGETELARIWTKVEQIKAKQAAKPTGSALPIAPPPPASSPQGAAWRLTDDHLRLWAKAFVTKQSCGEWPDTLIASDAESLFQEIRKLLPAPPAVEQG